MKISVSIKKSAVSTILIFVSIIMYAQDANTGQSSGVENVIASAVASSKEFTLHKAALASSRADNDSLKPSVLPDVSFTANAAYEFTQSASEQSSVPVTVRVSASLPQKNARDHVQRADSILKREQEAANIKAAADTAYQILLSYIQLEKNTRSAERLKKGAARADQYEAVSRGSRTDLAETHLRQALLHEKLELAVYERDKSRVVLTKWKTELPVSFNEIESFIHHLFSVSPQVNIPFTAVELQAAAAARSELTESITRSSYESRFLPRINASAEYNVLSQDELSLTSGLSFSIDLNTESQKKKIESLRARTVSANEKKTQTERDASMQYQSLIAASKSLEQRISYAEKALGAALELAAIAEEKSDLGALSAAEKNEALETAEQYEEKRDLLLFELLRTKLDAVYMNGALGNVILKKIEQAGLL